MSQWTHISGCLRIDDMMKIFKGVSSIDNDFKEKLEENSPKGSEGGLIFFFTKGEEGCTNTDNIFFYGDLRDFGEEEIIKIKEWVEWIEQSLKDIAMIRQLNICCDVEGKEERVYYFRETKEND
jgi:hypothetical protein